MEANRSFGKSVAGRNNRRTAILVAAVAAVAAAALIYLFVTHFRKTTTKIVLPQDVSVWVAKQYIPAGTPQRVIAVEGVLRSTHVPVSQAVAGALTDPNVVAGDATATAIEAGQQVTMADFTKTAANSITGYLKGTERGVAFSFDSEHGLSTYLQPTATVDVMDVDSKTNDVKLLAKDVTVIANANGIIVLRLTDRESLLVTAGTLGAHSLWLSMRPTFKPTNSIPVGEVGQVGSF